MYCSTSPTHEDRRAHHRFRVQRDGKLARPGIPAFQPLRTRDLSLGGCLADTTTDRPFAPGDTVDLVIALRPETGLLRASATLRAHVVRAGPLTDRTQQLALRYLPAAA